MPAPTVLSLMAEGNAAYLKGDYESGRTAFREAWDAGQQLPPADPVRYDVLTRLVAIRAAGGEFEDAA